MARRPALLRYLAIVLVLGLGIAPLLYFALWTARVSGCRRLDRPGAYLSYCANTEFGSYEHEAYRFGLEPDAVAALQQADVLFLGNSRLQHGFSTHGVDAFFARRGVRYHLLGFGYGESSRFPRELILRHWPKPKVVIINADPFFQNALSPAALLIAQGPRVAFLDGLMKRLFDRLGPLLCRIPALCTGVDPATYRDRRTGQWIWQGVLAPAGLVRGPITADKPIPWSAASLPAWQRDAALILPALGVPPDCVILTGVPTPATDAEGMARALGADLGLAVVQPALSGLTSLDNSHLSAESAERWSTAFLDAAAPRIDRCLAAGHAPSR